MRVSKKDIDKLNSIISIDIEKNDFESNVENVLKDYRKRANIPGFRKGHTPIGLIKKQYGLSVKVDEINKLIQKGLSDYLSNEKLAILGNPVPVEKNNIDWNSDKLNVLEIKFNEKQLNQAQELISQMPFVPKRHSKYLRGLSYCKMAVYI